MSCLSLLLPIPGFMSFGFSEILIVGVVALLVFGGNLPDVMRTLGRSYGKFRQGLEELSRPVRNEIQKVRDLPPTIDLSQPDSPSPPDAPSDEDAGEDTEYPEYPNDVYAPADEPAEAVETVEGGEPEQDPQQTVAREKPESGDAPSV